MSTLKFFKIAKNKTMQTIIERYKYYADKRFSTIAGTLVYFLLMSITPLILWLTLLFGNVNAELFLSNEFFASISPILRYLKSSAESAASGAGIILLITSLYSSTNFFYHLRRSGEIIYNSKRVKGGIKLRLASICLIFATITLFAILGTLSVLGSWLLEKFLPYYIAEIIFYLFLTSVAFLVAFVLNIFICPYKRKFFDYVPGSIFTTALWLVFLVGFTIYTKFASPERLYGKFAYAIIFLLWCYVMTNCFVIGVIYNSSFKTKKIYKEIF